MTAEDFLSHLSRLLGVPIGDLEPNTTLESLPAWDSLAQLELGIYVEDVYGIQLSRQQVRRFVTIQDVIDVVTDGKER